MVRIYHYNFGTVYDFSTVAEAMSFAEKSAFEAIMYVDGHRCGSYSPIGGWRCV